MKNIFLIDLKDDIVGHYHIMQNLAKIENTIEIDTREKKIRFKENPIAFYKERKRIIKETMNEALRLRKNGGKIIAHYLTIDKFYFLFWLFPGPLKDNIILATLHHIPKNHLLKYLLLQFSKRVTSLVVLSEYLKQELNTIGIKNVYSIQHPSFYDYNNIRSKQELRNKLNITDCKCLVLSCLGGTRYEKGLDILLEAFQYIPEKEKQHILLNIAGVYNDFSEYYILQKAKEFNIHVRCIIKRLTDIEFMENIILSDYIALPYRKSFDAMSGPLSEAMSKGIGCILPNHGIFKFYGKMQDNNLMFESENPQSLATSIIYAFHHPFQANTSTTNLFQLKSFIDKSQNLYSNLLKQ